MVCPLVRVDSPSNHDRGPPVAGLVLGSGWVLTRRGMKMVGKIEEGGLMRRRASLVTVDEDVAQNTKEENAYWVLETLSSP